MYWDCIAFAVYTNSQATMNIMLPSPGLEEPPSGQAHNILNKQTINVFRYNKPEYATVKVLGPRLFPPNIAGRNLMYCATITTRYL